MKVIITAPTIMGGVSYDPDHRPQEVPDGIAAHLIEIGNAHAYVQKVAPPEVTKAKKNPGQSSASQAAPASRKRTATKPKAK